MLRSLSFAKKILLAASLVVIFAFACFIFFNDFRQSRAIQEDTDSYLREIGSLTASNIQSWLEGRIHLVEMEAAQLADGEPTAERIQHVLEQQVLQRNFESVYLGEAASGVFTMRPYSPMPDGYDPRQRGWYKDAAAAGRLIVTEPFLDAGTKEQILAMSMPVMRNGQLVGVAAGDMKLQTITAILNSLKFDGDGYAFLVSDAGKILLHPDDGLRGRRGAGHDWTVVRLGAAGTVRRVEVDTRHFKGNAPGACSLEGCRDARMERWIALMTRTPLQAHRRNVFEDEIRAIGDVTHVRLNIYPDGGVGRLRLFGRPRQPLPISLDA